MPTSSHELKRLILLAAPLMAAFLSQKGLQIVDSVMLGRVGSYALAAMALAWPMLSLMLVFSMGLLSAAGVFIARAQGGQQFQEISPTLLNGFFLAFCLAIPSMVFIWFSPLFLLAVGEDPHIVFYAQQFLHGVVWGFPFFLFYLVLREFISAFHYTRIVMITTLCVIPIAISTNYLLIYGKWGFPALGVAGVGYAGALIQFLMFCSLLGFACKREVLRPHLHFHLRQLAWWRIRDMIFIGGTSGIILALDLSVFAAAAIMIGQFGNDALAGLQVAGQWISLAFSLPFGLSVATALGVSHAAGAKDLKRVILVTKLSNALGIFFAVLLALLFLTQSRLLSLAFVDSHDVGLESVLHYATAFIMIAALFQCFDAVQIIMNAALRGLKDTFTPMLISLVCYWVIGVYGGYLLAFHTTLGANGVLYGLSLGIASAAIILALRFIRRVKTITL